MYMYLHMACKQFVVAYALESARIIPTASVRFCVQIRVYMYSYKTIVTGLLPIINMDIFYEMLSTDY